jgi:hypothetical protein
MKPNEQLDDEQEHHPLVKDMQTLLEYMSCHYNAEEMTLILSTGLMSHLRVCRDRELVQDAITYLTDSFNELVG